MTTLRTTLEGSVRYRGREGQWSYLLHRITGLGTLLFLIIHVLDTSTVYFIPHLYQEAIELYRSSLFMIGEIILVFCVIFHGVNGLRIAYFDLRPNLWQERYQHTTVRWTLAVSLLLWLPAAFIMGRALYVHNILGL